MAEFARWGQAVKMVSTWAVRAVARAQRLLRRARLRQRSADAALADSTARLRSTRHVSAATHAGHPAVMGTAAHDDEQDEIDAEVAASAAAMAEIDPERDWQHGEHERRQAVQDAREDGLDRRQATGDARAHDLDRGQRRLAGSEADADERERVLDEREGRVAGREEAADQREIDAETTSW